VASRGAIPLNSVDIISATVILREFLLKVGTYLEEIELK